MKILKIKSLNINSLKGEFEIDFEKFLKDESLFAITGPTGAGKSTILDVITCALYGRTARLSNPNELMSRHTGECYCEVEYEIKLELEKLDDKEFEKELLLNLKEVVSKVQSL